MKVSIFQNITEEDGRLAIFSRLRHESRVQSGDQLQLVGILHFSDATSAEHAAELAFEAGNSPQESEAVKEYRSWKVRSLCVGDVVAVEDDKHVVTALACEPVGFTPVDLTQFKLVDAVIVSLCVENAYELYEDVEVTVTDVVLPAPPDDEESSDYQEWSQEYIIDRYTGTGHTDGDSWYDVEITASSDPALVGRTFDWGY
jgi:hypothetical protein